jgi:membrane associated rhomboid family serine protease
VPEIFKWYAVKLSVVIFIVYIITLIYPGPIYSNFAMVSSEALIKPWMFVTHVFLHGGLIHLGSNLFALLLFGSILEKTIGSKNFLIIFFAAGIVSGFADLIFYTSAVGASGAIFGVMGSLAVIRPKLVVWVMGAPMYMIVAVFLWALLDLGGMFYPSNIAHAAHLFGMVFGIAVGLWIRNKHREPKRKQEELKYEIVSDAELDEWERRYMV